MDGCIELTLFSSLPNCPTFFYKPLPSAEKIPQPEIDPFYPGVRRLPLDDNNTSTPVSSLEDLKGKVLSEAMNEYGSQFLIQKLKESKPEDIQMIFSEVKNHLYELMLDCYGSYVIQKFFEVCNEEQMTQSVISVTADVRSLMAVCVDPQGSQSMQYLLELVKREQLSHVISGLKQIMVPLVQHPIGYRVIQRYLSLFPEAYDELLFQAMVPNFLEIATSQGGCCLLEFLVSYVLPLDIRTSVLATAVPRSIWVHIHRYPHTQTRFLCISPMTFSGCRSRLVQNLIGLGMQGVIDSILVELSPALDDLSMHIYGSKVVRKLMKASNKRLHIISVIISSSNFSSILRDPCGRYVVKSAKKYATGTLCETLNHLILQHSDPLHSLYLGKNALLRNRLQAAGTTDGCVESNLPNSPTFSMQEIHHKPLQSAESIALPQIIDEFPMDGNNTSAADFSLKDLKGKILLKAMDEDGHKFLLQKLQESKTEDIKMIFSEVKDILYKLMLGGYGYYVARKLFQVCDEEQMTHLVISVTADVHLFMNVCLDDRGSESMRDLLECLTKPEQLSHILSCFKQIVVPLVKHSIGSRVIYHCFSIFPAVSTEPIRQVLADNFFEIATSEGGHCLHEFLISDEFLVRSQLRIFAHVMAYLIQLSKEQIGNHLVQHVIGLGMQDVIRDIVTQLRGSFVLLSMDIYGSNVVKKLMKASQKTYTTEIITEIISSPKFSCVLQDPYGKYVVQSAMKYATGTLCETLNHVIRQHTDPLPSQYVGKNVLLSKKRKRNHVLRRKKKNRGSCLMIQKYGFLSARKLPLPCI